MSQVFPANAVRYLRRAPVMLCVSATPKPRDRYRYTRDGMFTAMAFVVLFLQVLLSNLVFCANTFGLNAAATLIARDPRRDG